MVSSATLFDTLGWSAFHGSSYTFVLLLSFFGRGNFATANSDAETLRHLDLGRDMLARGQLADALTHYHAAVELDPRNYLTYFKRGTVYLALGKSRPALADLSLVLELKPDFVAARSQRGSVYMKLAQFDAAENDFLAVLAVDPTNADSTYNLQRIAPARDQAALVDQLMAGGDHRTAVALLTQLLELCPWSSAYREARATCYIELQDILSAVSDLRSVNRLSQDSSDGYFRLSTLLYGMGHATDALKEIRECLRLDPEHADCFPFYKVLKRVEKGLRDAQTALDAKEFDECSAAAERVLRLEQDVPMVVFGAKQLLCQCLAKAEKHAEALTRCTEALEMQKDAGVLCQRGNVYTETEMFDDAVRDFQAALELDESLACAKEGIERARKLQKQSERRDYYKILNVKRTATKQEIVKAYRKAAQKWHPDAYHGDQKKMAEKKFIDVAAAKEVLTDPEKRRIFDQGEDPLDPEAGRNAGFGGGNPFHQFHQQGGSPFQFKFHFN